MTITTLKEAQEVLKNGWKDANGVQCPCCGQKVKRYKRKLNSSMTRNLISLVLRNRVLGTHVHVSELADRNVTDFAQLRRWQLIAETVVDEDGKKNSGYWTPTELAKDFVYGRVVVPKYAYIYNNKTLGLSEETTTIKEALGSKFNYKELMRGV